MYLALADSRDDDAEAIAKDCDDDTVRATLLIRRFRDVANELDDATLVRRARETAALVDKLGKPELAWTADQVKGRAYHARRRFADAIESFDAALASAPRTATAGIAALKAEVLLERARPSDLALARDEIDSWRALAVEHGEHGLVERFDWLDATAQWLQGDPANANRRLVALHEKSPPAMLGSARLEGIVVDSAGKPVAGATVAGGYALLGDGLHVATPLYGFNDQLRLFELVRTDEHGKFVLEHAPNCFGVIAAQHGTLRSRPVVPENGVRIVVAPTTQIRGRVALGGRVGTFLVSAGWNAGGIGSVGIAKPVSSDGEVVLDGVVSGEAIVGISEGHSLDTHAIMQRVRIDPARPPANLVLEPPAGREVRVLVRGVTFVGAPVFAFAGKFTGKTLGDIFKFRGRREMATTAATAVNGEPPIEIAAAFQRNDLLATFRSAPTGLITVCALERISSCAGDFPLVCTELSANAALGTIAK